MLMGIEPAIKILTEMFLFKREFGVLSDWLPTRFLNSSFKIGHKIGAALEPEISDNFNQGHVLA